MLLAAINDLFVCFVLFVFYMVSLCYLFCVIFIVCLDIADTVFGCWIYTELETYIHIYTYIYLQCFPV